MSSSPHKSTSSCCAPTDTSSHNENDNITSSPNKLPVILDDSDTTSLTTTSTNCTGSRTPSPFSSDIPMMNPNSLSLTTLSAGTSPTNSGTSSNGRGHDSDNVLSTPYSMLSAFLSSTPLQRQRNTPTDSPQYFSAVTPIASGSLGSSANRMYIEKRGSWSDSDDYVDSNNDRDDTAAPTHDDDCQLQGSPSWSIQQALFPEDETENMAPSNSFCKSDEYPSIRKGRRLYSRSVSDSPSECAAANASTVPRHSWSSNSPVGEPVRTRRSRRSVVATRVESSNISKPSHRRRNSTGGNKLGAGGDITTALLQGGGHCPKHSSIQQQPAAYPETVLPSSNSKSKRWKRKQSRSASSKKKIDILAASSTLLEDRLKQSTANCSPNAIQVSTETPRTSAQVVTGSPSSRHWRTLLCRVRLVTLVWGLVAIGITSLGRAAMLATDGFDFGGGSAGQHSPRVHQPPLGPPTGGLRGSLLLATVGRQPSQSQSHSSDAKEMPVGRTTAKKVKHKNVDAKKKKADGDKKKEKVAEKHKHHQHQHQHQHQHHKTTKPKKEEKKQDPAKRDKKATINRIRKLPKVSFVARPPPLEASDYKIANAYHYELHDASMVRSSTKPSSSFTSHQRVVLLHDDVIKPKDKHRQVHQYPADFTDNTQFYGRLDSSDERLRKMELREPHVQGECVPMQSWQTTFHPSCNGVHELGVEYLGEETTETDVQLFGTKGYWRYAWRLDLRKQKMSNAKDGEHAYGDRVVLKTLKFRHDFEDAHFEHDRIDAVAMERLTSSPHVINAFGFCGHSVLTEFANGPRLGELADKSKSRPLARLRIARDIANGLADVHGIDHADGNNATFVHLDINPANVVSIGGTLKLNDFNIGIIRRWNTTSQKPCGFPAQYPNPQWRSPEEARNENNLTEKVDVFSMGHIFFRLICGHEPWNKLEPGGRPTKEEVNSKVQQGKLPYIPESVRKTKDPEVAAIRNAMLDCYKADPSDRPRARDIAKKLGAVLDKLSSTMKTPRD